MPWDAHGVRRHLGTAVCKEISRLLGTWDSNVESDWGLGIMDFDGGRRLVLVRRPLQLWWGGVREEGIRGAG
jgi:hypothetical protein